MKLKSRLSNSRRFIGNKIRNGARRFGRFLAGTLLVGSLMLSACQKPVVNVEAPTQEPPTTIVVDVPEQDRVPSLCGDLNQIDIENPRTTMHVDGRAIDLGGNFTLEYLGATINGSATFRITKKDTYTWPFVETFEVPQDVDFAIKSGDETLLVFAVCSINFTANFSENSVTIATNRDVDFYTPGVSVLPIDVGFLPPLGDVDSPVILIGFGDMTGPFDPVFHAGVEQQIISSYVETGKVVFYFRNFPLEHVHGDVATSAADIVMCANDQGKFWETRSFLLTNREEWVNSPSLDALLDNYMETVSSVLGMEFSQLRECVIDRNHSDLIGEDIVDGMNAGVYGEPTFFIVLDRSRVTDEENLQVDELSNEHYLVVRISGAQSLETFTEVFDVVE